MAGRHWRSAYGAALRHLATPNIPRLRSRTVFMGREDDVLYGFLDRLPQPLPASCSVERIPPQLSAWRTRLLDLLRHADLPREQWRPPPAPGPARAPSGNVTSTWCTARFGCGCGVATAVHRCCCSMMRPAVPARCSRSQRHSAPTASPSRPTCPDSANRIRCPIRASAATSRCWWRYSSNSTAVQWTSLPTASAPASASRSRRIIRLSCGAWRSTACRWCVRGNDVSTRGTIAHPWRRIGTAPTYCAHGSSCATRRRAGRGLTAQPARRDVMIRSRSRAPACESRRAAQAATELRRRCARCARSGRAGHRARRTTARAAVRRRRRRPLCRRSPRLPPLVRRARGTAPSEPCGPCRQSAGVLCLTRRPRVPTNVGRHPAAMRTRLLPKLPPRISRQKAAGAFSRPSVTSSR